MQQPELAAKERRMATLHEGQILRQYCNKRAQKRQTEIHTPAIGMDTEKGQSTLNITMSPIKVRDSCPVLSTKLVNIKSLPDSKLPAPQTQVIVRKFSLPASVSTKPKQRWKQLCNLQHEMTTTLPMSSVKMMHPSRPLTREYCPGTLRSRSVRILDVMNSTLPKQQTVKNVDLDSCTTSQEENCVPTLSSPVNKTITSSDDTLLSKVDYVNVEEMLDMAEEVPDIAAVAEVSSIGETIKFGPFETAYSNIGVVGSNLMIFQPLSGTKRIIQQEGGNSKVSMIVVKSAHGSPVEAMSGKGTIKPIDGKKDVIRGLLKTPLSEGNAKTGSELTIKEHGPMQETLKHKSEPSVKEQTVIRRNLKCNAQFIKIEQNCEKASLKQNSEPNNRQQKVVQENLKHNSELSKTERRVMLRNCKDNTDYTSREQSVTDENLKHGLGPSCGDQDMSYGMLHDMSEQVTKEQDIVTVNSLPQDLSCLKVTQDGIQGMASESLQTAAVVPPQKASAHSKDGHRVVCFDKETADVSAEQKRLRKLHLQIMMMKRRQNIAMHVERNVLRAKELKLVQEVMLPARKVLLSEMGTQTNLFSLVEPGRMVEMIISSEKLEEPSKMVSSKIKPVAGEGSAVRQQPSGYVLNSGSHHKIVLSGCGKKVVAEASEQDDKIFENNIFPSNGVITMPNGPDKKRVRLDVGLKFQNSQENSSASADKRTTHISSDAVSVDAGSDVTHSQFQNSIQRRKTGVNILALNSSFETFKARTLRNVKACKNVALPVKEPPRITDLKASNKPVKCGPLFSAESDRKSVYDIIVQHNIAAHGRKSQLKQKSMRRDISTNENRATPMVYFPDSGLLSTPRNVNMQDTAVKITKEYMQQVYEDWSQCCIPDECGNIPLHKAVINENLTIVKRQCVVLCVRKFKLDVYNFDKETPLHVAVMNGNAEISSMLLSFGAQPSIKDGNGNTALHLAVLHGNLECVRAILNTSNANPLPLDDLNDDGYSPLHLCAVNGRVEEMKCLIMKGAEVNLKDAKSGRTPLFHAVEADNCDLVQLLLSCDANPNEANFCGQTPVTAASEISFTCRNAMEECSVSDGMNFSSKLVPLSRGSNVTHTVDEGSEIVFEEEVLDDVNMKEVQKSALEAHCCRGVSMSSNTNNSNNQWFMN